MVTFGGVLLAVVVVVVAGPPGVEGRGTENSQIWVVIFLMMKLIKKVKELKGFGASAAHGPFWGSHWGEGRGGKEDLILLEIHHFQWPNCMLW